MQSSGKTKLVELNELLTCTLCKGYFIDATTIVECLHSFCRTCIVNYLQTNHFCPSCEVQVHKTKPLDNIRSDQTLQDIVYKLVPGLFKNEMKRRRVFYQQKDTNIQKSIPASSEKRGDIWGCNRLIFTPEDVFSISLEFSPLNEQTPPNVPTNMLPVEKKDLVQYYKRYFNCPGSVKIHHLKKLLQAKYSLAGSERRIEILYMHDLLKDQYTLVDLAYIYSWKRNEPLQLFLKITQDTPQKEVPRPHEEPAFPSSLPSTSPVSSLAAAAPASRHPSPPPSPQMAQEPNDIAKGGDQGANVPTPKRGEPAIPKVQAAVPGKDDLRHQSASEKDKLSPEEDKKLSPEEDGDELLQYPAFVIPKLSNNILGKVIGNVEELNCENVPPKLKSALKKTVSEDLGRFSLDSQLPLPKRQSKKKRVSFSVNLVQDNMALKRRSDDFEKDPFEFHPVKGTAMTQLKKKFCANESS